MLQANRLCKLWQRPYSSYLDRAPLGDLLVLLQPQQQQQQQQQTRLSRSLQPRLLLLPLLQLLLRLVCQTKTVISL
jgi:hypothetical protein